MFVFFKQRNKNLILCVKFFFKLTRLNLLNTRLYLIKILQDYTNKKHQESHDCNFPKLFIAIFFDNISKILNSKFIDQIIL